MRIITMFLFGLGALSAGCSTTTPKIATVYNADSVFEKEAEHVLLVSFDGLRPDAIGRADTPHLLSMKAAGAYATTAQAVLPSITLVNHASMIAGVGPSKHLIDWNDYYPDRGLLTVPTIFDLAHERGITTAMVAGKKKFIHLNRPGTIDHFLIEDGSSYAVAKEAIRILSTHRPRLMMIHFRHADTEGHAHGWMSGEQLEAIENADQALGHVLNALKDAGLLHKTAVIATADHGGDGGGHGGADHLHMSIPWIATGAEIPVRGALASPVTTYDTATTVAELLELSVPADWDGRNVF